MTCAIRHDAAQLRRETEATIDLFASWGVAVFAGSRGEKGPRVPGWPEIDPQTARDLTLEDLRRRSINIAARTGPELGVIDLDGKNGVDPGQALGRLLRILPDGVPVSRTSRGTHVFFRPTRVVGDGLLPEYGGELFTAGHMVNLPPSRHPNGADYVWLTPPGGELPVVDLEALGLVPQQTKAAQATGGDRRRGRLEPTSPGAQEEFRALMAQLGIRPERGGDELLLCESPQHQDAKTKSLHVNW